MPGITKVSVQINQTPEKVWEALMNPSNLKHWLTGFVSVEPMTGKIGEQGSTSKMKFLEGGREIELTETVLKSIPNQQYAFRMVHTSFETEVDIRLVSFGNRTELIQTAQFYPKTFFMKLASAMMKGSMKKRTSSELYKLKNLIEATHAAK